MFPIFRAEYEALKQFEAIFEREAERVRQTIQQIQRILDILQGGDWVGLGATAFFAEMNSEVLPALKNLASALEAAARTTRGIAKILKDLEEELTRLFAAMLASWTTGLAAAAAGGIAGALGGAADALGAAGGALGAAAGALGAAAGGVAGAVAGAAQAAANAAATDQMLAGMDPGVRAIVRQSPSLEADLAQLHRAGWTITTRNGGGSETDSVQHTMTIDTSEAHATQVGSLAHESAHARYGDTPFHPATTGMTRNQFIQANLRENMLDEANAQFNEAAVRDEVARNGGPDTGVSGTQSADYQRIYNDFRAGNITRQQAVSQMADIFPNETTGNTGQTYRDYYTGSYSDWWNRNVGRGRRVAP
ncbi:MAG TPA: WXG100 family type VII secretion target [Anaerolineales bacterium]|nr:WXG100 family type VII secretion target [Anaerolineales bacterium]